MDIESLHYGPVLPANKKELLKLINELEITDIRCESIYEDRILTFSLVFTTKDGRDFHFFQDIDLEVKFNPITVLDVQDGNGYELDNMKIGSCFKRKKRSRIKEVVDSTVIDMYNAGTIDAAKLSEFGITKEQAEGEV
jgi:hypothetical protein